VLGLLFLGIGLAISAFSRTRVQALVTSLLIWCLAVFVFDLVALSLLVSSTSPGAAQEIELICEATHVNTTADLHSAFDNVSEGQAKKAEAGGTVSLHWLAINPVDLFRAVNLSSQLEMRVPALAAVLCVAFWLTLTLGASSWKLRRTDL
jgi:ABC-type transport system involved in multi-copper enzyme maturation permease subunit